MATPGVPRTSRSTTEPCRSSNQRERADLPTISCVARASAVKLLRPSSTVTAGTLATSAPNCVASASTAAMR